MGRHLTAPERSALLRLARTAIEDRLHGDGSLDRLVEKMEITPGLRESRGAFVTLREKAEAGAAGAGRLRGCIGSIEAKESLYRSVIHNAVHSAFDDPRFPAVRPSELPGLTIEISALTPLHAVEHPGAILPGRDGVNLERGSNRAVFLPQVATEQGWGTRELLENLALKADLPRDGWRGAKLQIFQAEVFGEPVPPDWPSPGP